MSMRNLSLSRQGSVFSSGKMGRLASAMSEASFAQSDVIDMTSTRRGDNADKSDDSDWGSEFGEEDDNLEDDFEVEADQTGQLSVVEMVHRIYWEGKEDLAADPRIMNDTTGRYQYLVTCRDKRVRPNLTVTLNMSGDTMSLPHHALRVTDALALAEGLKVNKSIRVLDLKDNPIGDAGNTALAQALATNDTVEELSLRQTKMTWQAGIEWGKAMGPNSTLVRVDLRANKIGDTGIGLITTSLAASKALEYLNIADNQASGKAAAGLALMLKGTEENITPLKHLDLSWNHVRPEGIKVMCLAAVPHTTLTTMSLAWNGGGDRRAEEGGKLDAGDEGKKGDKKDGDKKEEAAKKKVPAPGGGEALCTLIRDNKSITELDLTSCRLGSDGCGMLPAAILANGVVKRIRLDGNRLGADLGAKVLNALKEKVLSGQMHAYTIDSSSDETKAKRSFDAANPNGSYRLNLSDPADVDTCKELMKLARLTLGEAWRNERLDGKRFYFPNEKSAAGKWAPPPAHPNPPAADGEVVTGGGAKGPILELDVVYADPLDPDTEPCDVDDFRSLMRAMELSTTEGGRLALLRQANQAYFWTISQVLTLLFMYSLDSSREEAMVILFSHIIGRDYLFLCAPAIADRSRLQLQKRLGCLSFLNRKFPAGKFVLDMGKMLDRQCLRCIKEALYKDRRVRITNVRFAFLGGLPFDVKPRTEAWRALLHTADTLGDDSSKQKGGGRRRKEDDNVDPYQVKEGEKQELSFSKGLPHNGNIELEVVVDEDETNYNLRDMIVDAYYVQESAHVVSLLEPGGGQAGDADSNDDGSKHSRATSSSVGSITAGKANPDKKGRSKPLPPAKKSGGEVIVPVYAGASTSSKPASREGHVRSLSSHGSRGVSREGGPSSRGGASSGRDESVDDIIAAFPAGSRPLTGGGPFSAVGSRPMSTRVSRPGTSSSALRQAVSVLEAASVLESEVSSVPAEELDSLRQQAEAAAAEEEEEDAKAKA